MIFNYYWHWNWIGLECARWGSLIPLRLPFFAAKLWGRRWRILINSCLMKNTFTNWRSSGKRGKLLPVGCHQEEVATLRFLSAPMTSPRPHFLRWKSILSTFSTNFWLPGKWIQFFFFIIWMVRGRPHIEFVLSIKEAGLLATISRPRPRPRPHPRPAVSQVADAFTHTSLPVPLPQPLPRPSAQTSAPDLSLQNFPCQSSHPHIAESWILNPQSGTRSLRFYGLPVPFPVQLEVQVEVNSPERHWLTFLIDFTSCQN